MILRGREGLSAEGWLAESCSQWGREDKRCLSPSLHSTSGVACASELLHIAADACLGTWIRASSALGWLHWAK